MLAAALLFTTVGCTRQNGAGGAAERVSALLIIPMNCMSGQLWDLDPLSPQELDLFLRQRLPGSQDVPPDAGQIEVFEAKCGKRVFWIPPDSRPTQREVPGTYREYLEWCQGSPPGKAVQGPSVGEYLEAMLASLTPRVYAVAGKEIEIENSLILPDGIYVALVTKRSVLILLVPRDYTRSSLP